MSSHSFAQLWNEYQAGDPDAKNRIASEFIPRIMGLLKKSLRNESQRDDVAQSVLMSFVANHEAKVDKIQKWDELWDLFAGITLRHCSKHNKRNYRSASRGPIGRIGVDDAQDDVSDQELPPDAQAALRDLFEACNRQLTPREQQILGRHLTGADRREIAKALEISIPTVDRALKRIKEVLTKLDADAT